MDLIEEFTCSQEERPLCIRKIAKQTGISRPSIRRMAKKRNFKQFKRLKTLQMSEGTRNRRETRTSFLRKRLESNIGMIEQTVLQDEKDLTFKVPANLQDNSVYGHCTIAKIRNKRCNDTANCSAKGQSK